MQALLPLGRGHFTPSSRPPAKPPPRQRIEADLLQRQHPRELVKSALARNAAAIAVAHNHPSGQAEPSRADEFLTQTLKSALALVDIRLIDHFVVAGDQCVSFAERGLL